MSETEAERPLCDTRGVGKLFGGVAALVTQHQVGHQPRRLGRDAPPGERVRGRGPMTTRPVDVAPQLPRYPSTPTDRFWPLRSAGQARERRRQATHPARVKPELVATGPGQVWSWDITKIRGPQRGVYYELYVILDIFSRYVVGWTIAARESAEIAEHLIAEAITIHGRPQSLHADRGTSMTSKPVAQLLVDLGVARSHSRPHVSNDNPYSEAQFKTLKYAPVFPDRFGSLADARAFCDAFFTYYNHEHRHSGIGLHTPASVHHGTAEQVRKQRATTLNAAYAATPSRFGHRRPEPPRLPETAWINQPSREALIQTG